ncbi:MAG: hypothetical protein QUS09_04200 [Methanotrichaceae archaeon]|nr:hypothetical protein [Methanotrichaceae archaeon]
MHFLMLSKQFGKAVDGGIIPSVVGWFLRVIGLLTIPATVFVSIRIWSLYHESIDGVFNPNILLTRNAVFMSIVQLNILMCAYFLLHILWLRGSRVIQLPNDPDFSATPAIVAIVKTLGECLGVLWMFVGILGGVLYWYGSEWRPSVPIPFVGQQVIDGFIAVAAGAIYCIITIVALHFFAEMIGVIPHIAQSLRKLGCSYEESLP